MASYKLTGYHSHRHPFLGADVTEALASDFDVTAALAAAEEEKEKLSWPKVARPLIAGGVAGLVTYATCRAFDVDKRKSRQVSFVLAGVNILVGLASDWIYNEMQELVKTADSGVKVSEIGT